ncbi:tRNA (adenosine(37)-N6)-threonylcarbamoyltransferase complex ATPase subunit type 1 TsaE [Pararhodospirillum oryzae]|uniref:tRNA threonylcarbamoyladenosine biosynthesis protein TsaE n=1 Tax=Pararhodospirillum oryzae TaxID=478448 RepID=A0A512H668_9PROT|nr:tRNA (adenosine(37)-N6)-threonylcarbamoyltransferase complex ATPase subunit type 1 TsaE [Pararhodospirillum oryzae]GEO80931.1 tRNA (adenosine(37)-N6)-threonylcarbamoyltransferase complex ATPase subunit type 1 TsaE [Pararhodospirillum oryzae]
MNDAPRPRDLILPDDDATTRLGAGLARLARAGDVIALWGDLGAGKSTLARGAVRALTTPGEDVPSPTFTLVQTYDPTEPGRPPVWHFDLYRLDDPEEALALDLDDAFAEALSLIEWPERLGVYLPDSRLDVALRPRPSGETGREARLVPQGGDWDQRLPLDPLDLLR